MNDLKGVGGRTTFEIYSSNPCFQMGTNYKAALIPPRIRETIHGWGKEARRRRKRRHGCDESTIRTETSTVCSIEDDDQLLQDPPDSHYIQIGLQPTTGSDSIAGRVEDYVTETGNLIASLDAPLLHSASLPASPSISRMPRREILRSSSMPQIERLRNFGSSRFKG